MFAGGFILLVFIILCFFFEKQTSMELGYCLALTVLKLRLNIRVCSWLRLNAGGMLYTCKSNGSGEVLALLPASGERVSNILERTE